MNLAKYSLDNTKVIYFFLAVLLLGGIFSFSNLGKKEDAPFPGTFRLGVLPGAQAGKGSGLGGGSPDGKGRPVYGRQSWKADHPSGNYRLPLYQHQLFFFAV